jgi:hypothetical protein
MKAGDEKNGLKIVFNGWLYQKRFWNTPFCNNSNCCHSFSTFTSHELLQWHTHTHIYIYIYIYIYICVCVCVSVRMGQAKCIQDISWKILDYEGGQGEY